MEVKYYVGYHYGTFENDRAQKQEYASLFVVSDFDGTPGPDYNFKGMKAEKLPCVNKDVVLAVSGLNVGDLVELQFNQKGKVTKITPVK